MTIRMGKGWAIIASMFMVVGLAHGQAESPPEEIFTLDGVEIGITAIDEIQAKYGKANIVRASKEEEADVLICYAYHAPKGEKFVVFESGPMGGFKSITGFRIAAKYPRKDCVTLDSKLSDFISGNGIRLGQSRKIFLSKFNISFKPVGASLIYKGESKRKATQQELDRIHAMWPNEEQTDFDVTINIKAAFKNDRLVDYYVSKFESY
jgi:hypothetical protein